MHRLFVAIPLPEAVRDLLVDTMPDSPELRWVSHDLLHVTLRFIGEVERPFAEDIATALAAIRSPPLELRIAGAGQFARRSGGVLWAGVEPRNALSSLAAKVDRACVAAGLEPERRAFHPHITLSRWNGQAPPAIASFLARNGGLRSEPFSIKALCLFESHLSRHGPHYEPIASYPLTAVQPAAANLSTSGDLTWPPGDLIAP